MKELETFYLTSCPYCINARKAIDELTAENPAYAGLSLRWINEQKERALAEERDYYYVPTFYFNGEKLYECSPRDGYETIKAAVKNVFDTVLARA